MGKETSSYSQESSIIMLKPHPTITEIITDFSYMSYPIAFLHICIYLIQGISLAFVASQNKDYKLIDGIGISNFYVTVTCLVVGTGLINSFETLGSNAIGANNYRLLGLWVHRVRIITMIYLLFINTFNYFFGLSILSYFITDPITIESCSQYLYIYMSLMFFLFNFELNYRLMVILGSSHITCIIILITTVLHPIWCYILIVKLQFLVSGAGYSLLLTHFLNFIATHVYLSKFNPEPDCWFFIDSEVFKNWKEYFDIAIPSTFLQLGEWVGYEIQTIFALSLTPQEYTVHLIMVTIDFEVYSFSLGFAEAICLKVGEYVVEHSIPELRRFIKICLFWNLLNIFFLMGVVYLLKVQILFIYTEDPLITSIGLDVIKIVVFYFLTNNLYFFFTSIFRGLNYIYAPTLISIGVFYLIQIPLSLILVYKYAVGIKGIWISLSLGNCILILILIGMYNYHDFSEFKKETRERLNLDIKVRRRLSSYSLMSVH